MCGADGVCIGVCGHLGDLGGLGLSELHVGDDAADGGVGAVEWHFHRAGGGKGGELHVDDLVAIGCGAHAGHPLAGGRVDHVATGVDRDHGAHLDGAECHGSSSQASLHAGGGPHELAYGGAGAGTYIALLECGGGMVERLAHGGDTGLNVGTHGGIAKGEVEDAAGTHDGHLRGADGQADAAALEFAGHAACRFETKGRTARKADGVDLIDGVLGTQQIGLARSGSATTYVNAAGGTLGRHDYGAAGTGLLVCIVAKAKAIDIANVNGFEQCVHVFSYRFSAGPYARSGSVRYGKIVGAGGYPAPDAITRVFESRVRRERWVSPPRCRSRPKCHARACGRLCPGYRRLRPCPWVRRRQHSARSAPR